MASGFSGLTASQYQLPGLGSGGITVPGLGNLGTASSTKSSKPTQADIKAAARSQQLLDSFTSTTGIPMTDNLMKEAQNYLAIDKQNMAKNHISANQEKQILQAQMGQLGTLAKENPAQALAKVLGLDDAYKTIESKAMDFMAWAKGAVQPLGNPPKKSPPGFMMPDGPDEDADI
jgi:hypothetical protein